MDYQSDQGDAVDTVVDTLDTLDTVDIPQAVGHMDLAAQRQWEQYARDRGVQRYRRSLVREDAEGRQVQRALADIEPGKRLTAELVGPLAERLKVVQAEALARIDKATQKLGDADVILQMLKPEVFAVTTVLSAFSRCEPAPLQSCCLELGGRIQREVELAAWKLREKSAEKERKETDAPWQPNMHELMVKRNAVVDTRVFTKWSKKAKLFLNEGWETPTRLRIGTLLLGLLIELDGYFEIRLVRDGAKTRQMFQLVDVARQWVAQRNAQNELMRPFMLPMICEPRDYEYLPAAAAEADSLADE